MVLKDEEIKTLTGKSKFDVEKDDWKIPAFQLRQHEIMLPKIKASGVSKMMD
jgi:ABC-type antimicrobial peptide transport system ATPase subunit